MMPVFGLTTKPTSRMNWRSAFITKWFSFIHFQTATGAGRDWRRICSSPGKVAPDSVGAAVISIYREMRGKPMSRRFMQPTITISGRLWPLQGRRCDGLQQLNNQATKDRIGDLRIGLNQSAYFSRLSQRVRRRCRPQGMIRASRIPLHGRKTVDPAVRSLLEEPHGPPKMPLPTCQKYWACDTTDLFDPIVKSKPWARDETGGQTRQRSAHAERGVPPGCAGRGSREWGSQRAAIAGEAPSEMTLPAHPFRKHRQCCRLHADIYWSESCRRDVPK